MVNLIQIDPSSLTGRHPFDVMHGLSPEITELIHLDNQGVLSPEVRPLIARFRDSESRERVAAIEAMAAVCGFSASLGIVRVQESGKVERAKIGAQTAIRLQEMKGNLARAISKDHLDGMKYLSDNALRATVYEAQAYTGTVRFVESIRAGTMRQLSADRLAEAIRKAELDYLGNLARAETERAGSLLAARRDVINAYLEAQAKINREAILASVEHDRADARNKESYFRAAEALGKEGFAFLRETGCEKVVVVLEGSHGDMRLVLEKGK